MRRGSQGHPTKRPRTAKSFVFASTENGDFGGDVDGLLPIVPLSRTAGIPISPIDGGGKAHAPSEPERSQGAGTRWDRPSQSPRSRIPPLSCCAYFGAAPEQQQAAPIHDWPRSLTPNELSWIPSLSSAPRYGYGLQRASIPLLFYIVKGFLARQRNIATALLHPSKLPSSCANLAPALRPVS